MLHLLDSYYYPRCVKLRVASANSASFIFFEHDRSKRVFWTLEGAHSSHQDSSLSQSSFKNKSKKLHTGVPTHTDIIKNIWWLAKHTVSQFLNDLTVCLDASRKWTVVALMYVIFVMSSSLSGRWTSFHFCFHLPSRGGFNWQDVLQTLNIVNKRWEY